MHKLHELKDNLMKELEVLSMNGQISVSSLEKIHTLTDSIKNIDKIIMLEEYGESDEYSNRPYYSYGDRSYDGGSYEGRSYARNRDRRGRYSSERGRYSRDEAKEDMIEQIQEMMSDATSEKERQALQRCLSSLQNA